jgi:hypothetical protein
MESNVYYQPSKVLTFEKITSIKNNTSGIIWKFSFLNFGSFVKASWRYSSYFLWTVVASIALQQSSITKTSNPYLKPEIAVFKTQKS